MRYLNAFSHSISLKYFILIWGKKSFAFKIGPETRCGKNEIKNNILPACFVNEVSTMLMVSSCFFRRTSINKLMPSNVKNDIPMGNGIVNKNSLNDEFLENNVLAIKGLYLKKAIPRRLMVTPAIAYIFLLVLVLLAIA